MGGRKSECVSIQGDKGIIAPMAIILSLCIIPCSLKCYLHSSAIST
jgi:hypothetical protein